MEPTPPAPKRRPRPTRGIQGLPPVPRTPKSAKPPIEMPRRPANLPPPPRKPIVKIPADDPANLPTTHAGRVSRQRPRASWWSPSSWLPLLAFGMFFAGVSMLIPWNAVDTFVHQPDRTFPTVVVDAGHGGHDGGATSNGLREKDLTLDTALRLERRLRAYGFPVVLTRRNDRYLELFDRAHIANRIPRALFISIHFNDSTTGSGDGVETFYAQQKAAFSEDGWTLAGLVQGRPEGVPPDQGAAFATAIQETIVANLGVTDRGAKPRQLAVVRLTRCPAALVEGGFLNNPAEAHKLAQPDYRERLALAVAEGVLRYYREHEQRQRTMHLAER